MHHQHPSQGSFQNIPMQTYPQAPAGGPSPGGPPPPIGGPQQQPQYYPPAPMMYPNAPTMVGLTAFVESMETKQSVNDKDTFAAQSGGITRIRLTGPVWVKHGGAVSMRGNVKFQADSILTKGLVRSIKECFTGEGMKLMKVWGQDSGVCEVYVADDGKKALNLTLNAGESITVKGEDVIAFEDSVKWNIIQLKGNIKSAVHGAKYYIKLTGPGNISIGCHGDPIVLPVTHAMPLRTDPDNTVLWSSDVVPSTKYRVGFIRRKLGLYRETGEEKQWEFKGEGFVVVQPVEEDANSKKTLSLKAVCPCLC